MKLRLIALFIIICFPFFNRLSSQDYNVLDFGAVADGKTYSTKAIQCAIDSAHQAGGGKVLIPKGEFLIGTIILKSNVELHLERKSVLLGSTDPGKYATPQKWDALIFADSANNISITGKGTIDGQGAELALRIDSLFHAGKIDSSDYNFIEGRPSAQIRPQLIKLSNSENVVIRDILIKSASSWVQSYFRCANLLIEGITVDSDTYWNNDGIDVLDSKNVIIRNCNINASDDGICLKSYRGGYSDDVSLDVLCDNILVENCKVRSSASAVKLGTGSYRGFTNITIRNIEVYDTYRSAIAIESVHNGHIENVLVENIKAKNTGNAFFIRLGKYYEDGRKGVIKNVTIRDMKVQVPKYQADRDYIQKGPALPFFHNVFPSSIVGIEGHRIENLNLENIEITYPGGGNATYANLPLSRLNSVPELPDKYPEFSMFGELPAWGLYVRHAVGISLKDIVLKAKEPDYRPAIVFDDVQDIDLDQLKVSGNEHKEKVIFHNSDPVPID
jgi:polygalacturonase